MDLNQQSATERQHAALRENIERKRNLPLPLKEMSLGGQEIRGSFSTYRSSPELRDWTYPLAPIKCNEVA